MLQGIPHIPRTNINIIVVTRKTIHSIFLSATQRTTYTATILCGTTDLRRTGLACQVCADKLIPHSPLARAQCNISPYISTLIITMIVNIMHAAYLWIERCIRTYQKGFNATGPHWPHHHHHLLFYMKMTDTQQSSHNHSPHQIPHAYANTFNAIYAWYSGKTWCTVLSASHTQRMMYISVMKA